MKTLAKEEVIRIVRELHTHLKTLYGNRLKGVFLYGSYARNEAHDDSDIDVAVVLAAPINRWVERERVGDLTADISLRENCLLTAFIMSETEVAEKPYAIHRAIMREGMAV